MMKAVHEVSTLVLENVPAQCCTHACPQCGWAIESSSRRDAFYEPSEHVEHVLRHALEGRDRFDLIAIRPHGEATLDRHLGTLLSQLRGLGLPVVVYTNGSTLHRDDVRLELARADGVVLELSAADPGTGANLHHVPLHRLEVMLHGLRVFSSAFKGPVFTSSHLIAGVNAHGASVEAIADLASIFKPVVSYLTFEGPFDTDHRFRVEQRFAERVRRVVVGPARAPREEVSSLLSSSVPLKKAAMASWVAAAGVA